MSAETARRGPVVYFSAQWGGALLALGALQFVAAMVVVQLRYPGYSDFANYVSDLGSAHSPGAWLFNDSIRVLGVLGVIGVLLIRTAFRTKWSARAGLGMLELGLLGAFLVGTFPEGSPELNYGIHSLVSSITFIAAGIGLSLLALGMLRDTRWDGMRAYTGISGVVTLIATGLFATGIDLGLGPGGMERLIIAPPLLWGIFAGAHLLRLTRFRAAGGSSPEADSAPV